MARTIESPGVEINEIDLSLTAGLPVGTNVLVNGFAAQGPTNELINVTSVSELEQIFGLPTNVAERYFYHTCSQVLQSPANLVVTRLPWGTGAGTGFEGNYTVLLYPVSAASDLSGTPAPGTYYSACSSFVIGEPLLLTLTETEYIEWQAGVIDWSTATTGVCSLMNSISSAGEAGIIVINNIKTTVDEIYQGYYIGIADNRGFDTSDYDDVKKVKAVVTGTSWRDIPTTSMSFNLTGSYDSISQKLETIPTFDFTQSDYTDSIIVGLFRLRSSMYNDNPNVLTYVLTERYTGSLDYTKRVNNPNGGPDLSDYIVDKVNPTSTFLKVMVNPNLSKNAKWTVDGSRIGSIRVQQNGADNLYAIGGYQPKTGTSSTKTVGDLVTKTDTALRLAENTDLIPLDVVCEGGLGTIWTCSKDSVTPDNSVVFDESDDFTAEIDDLADQSNGSSSDFALNYNVIFNLFDQFCARTRKDCLFIADPIRQIFVQGDDWKVMRDVTKTFSEDIYWPLKNLYAAANSSYACTYGNWVKQYDQNSDKFVWLPMSGYVGAIMARVSAQYQPWWAPAGLNNGIIRNIVDIAINPTQKQTRSIISY